MNTKFSQSGFTLIELIVSLGLATILLGAIFGLYLASSQMRARINATAEVEQQGLQAMEIITQTIRNSSAISNPSTGASGASLTLSVPTVAKSPTIFSLSNGQLQIKEGTSAVTPITSNRVSVSNLTFQNLTAAGSGGLVRVTFTLGSNYQTGKMANVYSKTFVTSAALRTNLP